MPRKIKVGGLEFRAGFVPDTYDKDRNTIDVTWTTGAKVKRSSWTDGEFYEELSTKKAHVRLDRLNNGAPLLDNHGTGSWGGVRSLRDIIGVVEKADMKDGLGTATVRFSGRAEIQDIIDDIKSGIIRNVSVGYRVNKFEEQKVKVDGLPVLRAVDWEPMELSFVGIPADFGAQSRGHEPTSEINVSIEEESSTMPKREDDEAKKAAQAKADADAKAAEDAKVEADAKAKADAEAAAKAEGDKGSEGSDAPAAKGADDRSTQAVVTATVDEAQIRALEITRGEEIRNAVRVAKLEESFADTLVKDPKVTLDLARAAIFKELEKKTEAKTLNHRVEVNKMETMQARREAAVAGILNRFDGSKYKMEQGQGEFRQGSILDLARHFLALEGRADAYKISRSEVARRALESTSDFPNVLANTANKVLRDAYQMAPNTYAPFVNNRDAKDFKQLSSVQLGNGGTLQPMGEHGEYKRTEVNESAQKYAVEKFGLILGRTYELIMNDDLGAFTRIPGELGMRARQKENQIFWSLITGNQVMMEDSVACFATGHNNLTSSGTVISVASLSVGRAKLRLMKDLEGEILNLNPKYLIVPSALETVAQQFIAQISPIQGADVNVFSNKLEVIVEPRLDAVSTTAWYMAADKSQIQSGEMALIDGQGPEIFVKEGWEVDGMEMKIRYNFGMALVDYRGLYKNAGA